jgi:hypothetical protein
MELRQLYSMLDSVLPGKVSYGTNIYDNGENASMPYIVYQEISKRPTGYMDDSPISYRKTVQVTLVTKNKDPELEKRLEQAFINDGMNYSMTNESRNSDRSVSRVYEIKLEDF